MSRAGALLAALLLCLPAASAQKQDKQQRRQEAMNDAHAAQIDAAKQAAAAWLTIVDAERYEESWKQAASFLQGNLPEKDWEKRLNTMRKPIDPLVDRSLETTQYRDQFPGLPAGQYVALVWESYFGAKHQMLESVIVSNEGGAWKVVGYAVQ